MLSKQWGKLNRKLSWTRKYPSKSQEAQVMDTPEVEMKENIKPGEVVQVTWEKELDPQIISLSV